MTKLEKKIGSATITATVDGDAMFHVEVVGDIADYGATLEKHLNSDMKRIINDISPADGDPIIVGALQVAELQGWAILDIDSISYPKNVIH